MSTEPGATGRLAARLILVRKRGDTDHATADEARAAFEVLEVARPRWASIWRLTGTPVLVWQGWRADGASATRWTEVTLLRESWVRRLRRAITGGSESCSEVPRARSDRRGARTRRRPDPEGVR